MPSDSPIEPEGTSRADIAAATRVFGSQASVDLMRFMAGQDDLSRGVYWRDIAHALPEYPESSLRRQLGELEDAGVVLVEAPGATTRGGRRGVPVKYVYNPARLDQLFAVTRSWLSGEAP